MVKERKEKHSVSLVRFLQPRRKGESCLGIYSSPFHSQLEVKGRCCWVVCRPPHPLWQRTSDAFSKSSPQHLQQSWWLRHSPHMERQQEWEAEQKYALLNQMQVQRLKCALQKVPVVWSFKKFLERWNVCGCNSCGNMHSLVAKLRKATRIAFYFQKLVTDPYLQSESSRGVIGLSKNSASANKT